MFRAMKKINFIYNDICLNNLYLYNIFRKQDTKNHATITSSRIHIGVYICIYVPGYTYICI